MFLVVNAGGKEAYVIVAGMEIWQDNRQKNYQYHLVLTSQVSLHQEEFYFFFFFKLGETQISDQNPDQVWINMSLIYNILK